MKKYIHVFVLACVVNTSIAQDTIRITLPDTTIRSFRPKKVITSPYTTSFKVDGPIIAAGIGLTGLGVHLIDQKKNLTAAEVARKTPDKVPFFDRSSAGFYSERADRDSYVPFQYSFALPVAMMLINKNQRHKPVQVLALYVETMAVTGTLFTITAGSVQRSRPYVYGTLAPLDKRMDKNSHRSFFAGHTAATASATFFAAKVFQDFNPDSKLKPYVWGVCAAVPALVGYLRYKAGMHFISDNLLGYAIGAGAGILVPQLHKNKNLKDLSIVPQFGPGYRGVALGYQF
ncbi:phosphatase PAP2 family protein [Segetibacter sp. 3557_3]|uniref:phosphatase PAP2 family protein n=1 Tax=Segetibacter sp. 3557_3 TaxID=2547429 RepID=UPI001404611E|nr:phosphatase PAP2 family protein [Segetibacter sp. 3557_3]